MLRAFLLEIKGRWGGGPGRHLWVAVICKKCALMIHDLTAKAGEKALNFPKGTKCPGWQVELTCHYSKHAIIPKSAKVETLEYFCDPIELHVYLLTAST